MVALTLIAVGGLFLSDATAQGPPGSGGPPGAGGPPGSGGPPAETEAESPDQSKQDTSEPAPLPDARRPLGFAGESPFDDPPPLNRPPQSPAVAVPDRWRLGWPEWDRYGRQAAGDALLMNALGGDSPYTKGHPLNPYDRNVLKADYPVFGDDIFVNGSIISDTLFEARELPTPSGVSAANAGSFDFFGDGEQRFFSQNVLGTFEMFKGNTAFRPIDWKVHVTGAYNYNNLELQERNAAEVDVREGDRRVDDFATIQEAFFEYHLGDLSSEFDFAAVRAGRQLFLSDFRGFIFNDVTDGVRLLGSLESNRVQYNLAIFNQNEKDTNSGLARLNWRDQQVLIANTYIQDFIWKGYTTQFSFHWNHDRSGRRFDSNGFLVRPSLAGSVTLQETDAFYLGWTGDGHIGRLNINHALYYVTGQDDQNPIAGRDVDISAYMGAVELSYDVDWFRPKVSLFYASGDSDPLDGTARGFDGIHENPFFLGGPSSFFQSQAFRLFGVNMTSPKSLFNDLAGNKGEGQSNYVNPGTLAFGAGFDAEITPRLRASFNANSIHFAQTETLQLFLNQDNIDHHLGDELNLTAQYRPFLNNNVIFTVGGSWFFPGEGYEQLFESEDSLWRAFTGVTLTY